MLDLAETQPVEVDPHDIDTVVAVLDRMNHQIVRHRCAEAHCPAGHGHDRAGSRDDPSPSCRISRSYGLSSGGDECGLAGGVVPGAGVVPPCDAPVLCVAADRQPANSRATAASDANQRDCTRATYRRYNTMRSCRGCGRASSPLCWRRARWWSRRPRGGRERLAGAGAGGLRPRRGRVHRGPHQHEAPIASMAKVMTAYLVLKRFPLHAGRAAASR